MPYTAQERAELVRLLCQAAPSPETTRTPVSIEPRTLVSIEPNPPERAVDELEAAASPETTRTLVSIEPNPPERAVDELEAAASPETTQTLVSIEPNPPERAVDELEAAASPNASRSLDGIPYELKSPERAIRELEDAARDCINEFRELRGGALDERLATVQKTNELQKAARLIIDGMKDPTVRKALAEYGTSLPDDVGSVVKRLLEACDFYDARRSKTPGQIKSEGKSYSKLLASKLLDRFLLHASISWHDATGRGPKPNKRPDGTPSGPYARFVSLSVAPLIREFEDFRPGLIDFSWSGLCQRLVKSIKVREIKLLNPPTR